MKEIEAMAARRNRRKHADYDDEGSPNQFEVTFQSKQSGVYNIYLFGLITDASQFIGAIEVMNRATEDDLVVVHLQTPGGSIDAADTFISAMRECDADVLVYATGGVHSAGTMILMHAPMFKLSKGFNALVHNGSVGTGGKFSDFKAASKAYEQQMEQVLRSTYEGFLEPKELDEMIAGKDFWLDSKSFSDRFNKRQEFLKVKYGDLLKALEAEQAEPEEEPVVVAAPAPKTRRKRASTTN